MKDVIIDTLLDSVKLLPFLLVAFLLIELFEHKFSNKTKKMISKSGKMGPLFGSVLGLLPQCGFSVIGTNLYVSRVISLGTLISIYLATSDEMIPVMLSEGFSGTGILKILLTKFFIGMIAGFVIDLIYRKKEKTNYHICEDEHCHCEDNLFLSSLKHTFNTVIYIFIATFILNTVIFFVGEENISKVFLKDNFLAPFLSSLIGLIPNCSASVILTELYLKGALSFATVIAGLLTGSGVSLLVLFKSNKNMKENIKIITIIYLIGAFSGIIIEIIRLL